MSRADIAPWRWGGLRPWKREGRPLAGFRQEMDSLHREMDSLFERLWSEGVGSSSALELFSRGEILPQLDVTEDEKAFRVKVDLPGLDEKEVNVTLSDRILTIRGEKKEDKETEEKDYYRRERVQGRFQRRIEIPTAVDETKIEASFKKGVLTIKLPKTEEAKAKVTRVEINAA